MRKSALLLALVLTVVIAGSIALSNRVNAQTSNTVNGIGNTPITSFYESGLPNNAPWIVTYAGNSFQANAPAGIFFPSVDETAAFIYLDVSSNGIKYIPSLRSGTIKPGGSFTVLYSENNINTTFTESGLPGNVLWIVSYNNEVPAYVAIHGALFGRPLSLKEVSTVKFTE